MIYHIYLGMCKTIEDSIFSGTLSYLTGGLLIATGKPKYIWAGAFIIAVGSMQWVDAMIWYNKSQGTSSVVWSQFGVPTVLSLEILTGYLGYVYYSNKRILLYEPIMLTLMVFIFINYSTGCNESSLDKNGYLIWCGEKHLNSQPFVPVQRTIIMLFLAFPFLFYPEELLKYVILATSFGLWLYTIASDSFGSRWCQSFFVVDIIILAKLLIQGA